MRGQHTGLPQSQSRQQPGYDEIQLLHHQLMFKQLQELQRQQQIRQSGEELKQHNLMRQMSSVSKQMASCPLPAVVNGVPLHDSSNFQWQGEYAGNDLKLLNNSQMVTSGNMNLAQRAGHSMHELSNGFAVLPQDQAQTLQPFGFVSQQDDQSLYGLPVAGNRGWSNQYSQLHGFSQPQDLPDTMSKGGANMAFNSFRSSPGVHHQQTLGLQDAHVACRQDFPEKRLFGQLPPDSLKNSISTNFEQANSLERNTPLQDINAQQEQSYRQENYQGKPSHGPTPSSVSLDPTEQKILFSSDDDTSWDAFGMSGNMGAGGCLNGNSLDGNSFHGGSWSALMQSAVAEACSNTGLKEEWSGLSLQKSDVPSGSHTSTLCDATKAQENWFTNSSQGTTSAALGPISSLQNGNTSINDKKITGFQQFSAKFDGDRTKTGQDDGPYGSMQQSLHFSSPNVHNPLTQKQNVPSCSSDIQLISKGDGWVSNDCTSHVKAPFKGSDPGSSVQHSQMNDSSGTMFADKNHGSSIWSNDPNRAASSLPNSADGLEAINSSLSSSHMQIALGNSSKSDKGPNNYSFNEHDYDQGKQLLLNSSQSTTGKDGLGNNPLLSNKRSQVWESISSNADKVSDAYDREHPRSSQKELSNDNSYVSAHSHPDSSDSGGVARAGAETHSYAPINQNFHGHAGKKGLVPQKFQYHPMGNIGFVTEVNDPRKRSLFAQEQRQLPPGDSKSYQGHPQQASTGGTVEMDKGCVSDADRIARGLSQSNSRDFQVPHFLGGSSVVSPQSMRAGKPSQNMLELINKVDQSRVGDASKNYAGQTLLSQGKESMVPDGHISNPQYNQATPLQSFRLQLGPPFERQSASNNARHFSPQAVTDNNIQPHCPDGEEKTGAWPNSSASDQSMHLIHDVPKTGEFDGQPVVPQKTSKETSESSTQSKYMVSRPTSQSNAHNQVSNQHIFGTSIDVPNDQPGHSQFGESKHQQPSDSYIGNAMNGSSQNTLSELPTSVSPFRFASPQDFRSSLGSQSGPVMSHSSSPNFGPNARSSSQQIADQRVSLQPSMVQGISGNIHHIWSNFSAQRLSNNFLQKGMPSSLQQIGSNSFHTPSWIPAKFDNIGRCSSSGGACVVNSQNKTSEEERPAQDNSMRQFTTAKVNFSSHGQEALGNRISDGSSAMPSQSMVKMCQKESRNNEQGSFSSLQRVHQTPNHDTHGSVFRPPDAQNRSYSLLQQVQALKALEADQSNKIGKRLKGTDVSMESQSQCLTGKAPQNLKTMDGNSAGVRGPGNPADNELSAVVQRGSFPSNSRMLSFSSRVTEDQNLSKIARDPGTDLSCQDLSISKPSDSLNNGQSIGAASTISLVRSTEDAQARSQMAPSWVEHHGTLKGSRASTMHVENGNLQPDAEVASDHRLNSQVPESTCSLNAVASVWHSPSISASSDTPMLVHKLPKEVLDHNVVQRPKKRKSVELLPWHREVVEGSHWLHSIRMAETDWARATNRLIEKVEDEAEIIDQGSSILRSRKRLTLTTHFMQKLLPSIPAAILTEPVSTVYELVMFLVAKLGLGDSCSLVSSLVNGVSSSLAAENVRVGRFNDYERSGDQHFFKVVENFAGRTEKLESDVLRFEKRASVLDVRVECQDLERFSIINRFAKFHGRSQTEGVESSSTSETSCKTFPQRFVTAITMPGNPPEGLVCLSL